MSRLKLFLCTGLIVLFSTPLAAQFGKAFPRHDPDLIEKLYKSDFDHIADDNLGRMDLEAVFLAFRTDEKVPSKCSVFGPNDEDVTLQKAVKYITFLNSDSRTGQFPSSEFMTLSVLSGPMELPGVWALDPNMLAMASEIDKNGCKSARVQSIRQNLIKYLDQRMAAPVSRTPVGLPQLTPEEIAQRRAAIEAATRQATQTAPSQPPAPAAPAVQGPVIPIGSQLIVLTVDVIDLTSTDESRTYRAKLEREIVSGNRTVIPQGAEVLLKMARRNQPNLPASVAFIAISAVSTVVDGKSVALTTTEASRTVSLAAVPESVAAVVNRVAAGTRLAFTVQAVK